MESHHKYMLLVNKIEEIFQKGITLSIDVLHYIDSTLSNPSIKELEKITHDDTNCEKDTLVALIFSPDISIQIQLEDLLQEQNYLKLDQEQAINYLSLKKPQATLRFPDNKGCFKLAMPNFAAGRFISSLNITNKPDKRLLDAVQMYVSKKSRIYVKVKLRNSRKKLTENKIAFIYTFFNRFTVIWV